MILLRCNANSQRLLSANVTINNFTRSRRFSSVKAPDIYDVVILGGGPAGLGLAAALRASATTSNLRIGLIEAENLFKTSHFEKERFSNRCSSLTPSSVSFLEDIGAWQHMVHDRVQPYNCMNVWDGVSGQKITFDWATAHGLPSISPSAESSLKPRPQDRKTIAYMTENVNLTAALLARLRELEGISFFSNTRVDSIELGAETSKVDLRSWPILRLSTGKELAARLLVGADGPNSVVRTFSGIDSHGWDYERHGVVATLRLEDSELSNDPARITAYQRFLPTGPVALLPLPDGFASLVWSTTPTCAARLKTLSEVDMAAMVNAAFRLSPIDLEFMHTISDGQADELAWREKHTPFEKPLVPARVTGVQQGTVASFPLRMRHADTYVGERVALAGDAAHSIHPLAGQGLNLGLADVASLASVIGNAAVHGADIGSTISLESYPAQRYAANHVMLGAVDKLHKLYSFQSAPIVAARSLGLGLVERWGGLKGVLMGTASG